jgi:hypothetical protein
MSDTQLQLWKCILNCKHFHSLLFEGGSARTTSLSKLIGLSIGCRDTPIPIPVNSGSWNCRNWSRSILRGCPYVLNTYIMGIPMDPQALYYGDTHRSSTPILWEYPSVLKPYTMGVPIGPQDLYYGGTHGFSSPILRRSPQVPKSYIMGIPMGSQTLYYGGIHKSSKPIL